MLATDYKAQNPSFVNAFPIITRILSGSPRHGVSTEDMDAASLEIKQRAHKDSAVLSLFSDPHKRISFRITCYSP